MTIINIMYDNIFQNKNSADKLNNKSEHYQEFITVLYNYLLEDSLSYVLATLFLWLINDIWLSNILIDF